MLANLFSRVITTTTIKIESKAMGREKSLQP